MSKPLSAAAVATLALSAMAEDMSHKGRLWDDQRYAQGCTPGHARPSVSRPKKAKIHGKNKKKRRK
ncbi:hypothetical protein R0I08_003872 [Salmonella enterica]|nr:hypothetical protein [Salmonella enterica]ELN9277024.1 hypothetical protein [Salmonella enterica]